VIATTFGIRARATDHGGYTAGGCLQDPLAGWLPTSRALPEPRTKQEQERRRRRGRGAGDDRAGDRGRRRGRHVPDPHEDQLHGVGDSHEDHPPGVSGKLWTSATPWSGRSAGL
jgi:hypothetical protein